MWREWSRQQPVHNNVNQQCLSCKRWWLFLLQSVHKLNFSSVWVSWILCKCATFVYKPVFMGLWLKLSPLSLLSLFFLIFFTQLLYIVSCTEWVNALKDWLLLCNIFKQIKFAMCKQQISMPSGLGNGLSKSWIMSFVLIWGKMYEFQLLLSSRVCVCVLLSLCK